MIPRRTLVALLAAASGITVAAPSTGASGAGEPTETRTVEGAYGPVELPADPQRIVVDLMALDYLTALGLDAGNVIAVFGAGFFDDDHYLGDVLHRDDLLDPGFAFEANLEAIAEADPDLIVAPFDQIDGAPGFDEMEAVAPVLVVPTSDTRDPAVRYGGTASFQDWRTTLRTFGALFDRDAEAEAYIAATDEMIAAIGEEHGALIDSITATEMKSTPELMSINMLSSAQESGVLGTILMSELGFVPPPQLADVEPDEYGGLDLSNENLPLVDSDLLFVEVRSGSTLHTDSPLWSTLDVVADDAVFEVGNHWEYGGAVAARVVLADIEAALDELAGRG